MTATDLVTATFNDKVGLVSARLDEIDLKHTKALESQAEKLIEAEQLVFTHGNAVFHLEIDNNNMNDIWRRFERKAEEQLAKQEQKINKLTQTVSNLPPKSGITTKLTCFAYQTGQKAGQAVGQPRQPTGRDQDRVGSTQGNGFGSRVQRDRQGAGRHERLRRTRERRIVETSFTMTMMIYPRPSVAPKVE